MREYATRKKESNLKVGTSRGIGRRVQRVDPGESGEEDDEDYMVLKEESDSETSKPYYMEGFINGNKFKTMIDTGSPVPIFELNEIKQIMKREKLQVRPMIENERYVDINGKTLK